MEAKYTVVGSDNKESEEDWSVVFKLPRTELVYSEQHLAERWVDKEDKSMVESNWAYYPSSLRNAEQDDWVDKEDESVVDSNRAFIPQPLPVRIGMIPPILESDAANIEERTTMAVNEQQTINDRCNNIVSRDVWKNIHQGLEWWDRRYKPIKFIINCVASKKAYGNMRHYLNKVKGFGDDNIVFPLYVQQQKNYVLLSRQLHVNGSNDDFALTKKVYRLIPHNTHPTYTCIIIDQHTNPLLLFRRT